MFDSEDDHFVAMAFLCEEVDARIRTDRDASRAYGRVYFVSAENAGTRRSVQIQSRQAPGEERGSFRDI